MDKVPTSKLRLPLRTVRHLHLEYVTYLGNLSENLNTAHLDEFKREIRFYENHFKDFYVKQSLIVRKKIDWTLLLLRNTRIVPEKLLKNLANTDGLGKCEIQPEMGFLEFSAFSTKEI